MGITLGRIPKVISKKVDDLLSEYEWTPQEPEGVPTPYLSTLFQWLTTVIDSLALDQKHKDKAYEGATSYINDFYMVSPSLSPSRMLNWMGPSEQDVLTSRANTQLINQNALENVLVDIQFLKDQFMVVGLEKSTGVFDELMMVSIFFLLHPCGSTILNRVLHVPDREHTGERPSPSVPRSATNEICSCKTAKATSFIGEIDKVPRDTSRSLFEGARGEKKERS